MYLSLAEVSLPDRKSFMAHLGKAFDVSTIVLCVHATRAVPIWVFGMYQYPIWIPPKETDNR